MAILKSSPPLTVGAINNPAALETEICAADCDLVELRLDSLGNGPAVRAFAERCASTAPVLITARHPEEGGAGKYSATSRESLLRSLLHLAGAIDIELRSLEELSAVWTEASEQDLVRIASYHDFKATPDLDSLRTRIDIAAEAGAEVAKFAFRINSPADLQTVVALMETETPLPLSVMGMGPLAPSSRLLAVQLGSVLNYGYLGNEATAPGQWPAALLKQVIAASRS